MDEHDHNSMGRASRPGFSRSGSGGGVYGRTGSGCKGRRFWMLLLTSLSVACAALSGCGQHQSQYSDSVYSTPQVHAAIPTVAPTPPPAVAPPLDASVFLGNLANYDQVPVRTASASSASGSYDGSTFYYASYAVDGKVSTSWQEGVKGYGVGESLTLEFAESNIEIMSFVLGSHTFDGYYEENGKPRIVRFDFSDGSSFRYEFAQVSEQYSIILNQRVCASWLTITIESAYPGSKFEDTAIAEVMLYASAEQLASSSPGSSGDCQTSFDYYSNGAVSRETNTYSDGNIVIYEYYFTGVTMSYTHYWPGGNSYESVIYNEDGTAAYEESVSADGSGAVDTMTISYEYDNMGNKTKETRTHYGMTWILEYDSAGNVVRETQIDENGKRTVTKR